MASLEDMAQPQFDTKHFIKEEEEVAEPIKLDSFKVPPWPSIELKPFPPGLMMRTSPRWIHWYHHLFQVAIHLQLSYHVTLGFSKHVVSVLIITSSYDIETGWSWTRWKGDNDSVILDLVPAPDPSWINRYVHDKVLHHLFWANCVMYRIRALSPCCGHLSLVASNPRSLLLYIPRSRCCLDLGFV